MDAECKVQTSLSESPLHVSKSTQNRTRLFLFIFLLTYNHLVDKVKREDSE